LKLRFQLYDNISQLRYCKLTSAVSLKYELKYFHQTKLIVVSKVDSSQRYKLFVVESLSLVDDKTLVILGLATVKLAEELIGQKLFTS
jgi:hypothetical protein